MDYRYLEVDEISRTMHRMILRTRFYCSPLPRRLFQFVFVFYNNPPKTILGVLVKFLSVPRYRWSTQVCCLKTSPCAYTSPSSFRAVVYKQLDRMLHALSRDRCWATIGRRHFLKFVQIKFIMLTIDWCRQTDSSVTLSPYLRRRATSRLGMLLQVRNRPQRSAIMHRTATQRLAVCASSTFFRMAKLSALSRANVLLFTSTSIQS